MNEQGLLDELIRLGVHLSAVGDRLHVKAPKGVMTPDLRDALAREKKDLIALIEAKTTSEARLLAWAGELAQADVVLSAPIEYLEGRLRPITTDHPAALARQYLITLASARIYRVGGWWKPWIPAWWQAREDESLAALRSLHVAMQNVGRKDGPL